MTLFASLQIAMRAIGANKLRAALTMLGMIIGVGAVIAMVSIGQGAQASVTSQIEAMGTNLLFVRPGAATSGGVTQAAGTRPTLTYQDSQAIASDVTVSLIGVAPEVDSFGQIIAGAQNTNAQVVGTTDAYAAVRNVQVNDGTFLTSQSVSGGSLVAVIGPTVATALFGEAEPVGQTIQISVQGRPGLPFTVIGVTVAKGGTGFGNQDNMVYIPITTVFQRLSNSRTAQGGQNVSTINIGVTNSADLTAATDQITQILDQRHNVATADFTIQSQADVLQTASQITGVLTLLLGAIAGISLVVGGIGIMNIMLVSVTERTREIGIRKAIGAKRRDILLQFLVEAIVVSFIGGAIGILLGAGAAHIISGISISGSTLQTSVTLDTVLLACGVSVAIGVFFGIYPAMRASALNPIEALRYE